MRKNAAESLGDLNLKSYPEAIKALIQVLLNDKEE